MQKDQKTINFNGEIIFPRKYQEIYNNFEVIKIDFKFKFVFDGVNYEVNQLAELDKTLGLTYEDFINDYIRDINENYSNFFFEKDFNDVITKYNLNKDKLNDYLRSIEIISITGIT